MNRYSSVRNMPLLSLAMLTLVLIHPATSQGSIWNYFRFGDHDGFGFNGVDAPMPASGANGAPWNASGPPGPFWGADGNVVDSNGNGRIDVGELLPDVNRDGHTRAGWGDDWDNRGLEEFGDGAVVFDGTGTMNNGSTGSKWTDVTLSTTHPWQSSSDNQKREFPDPGGADMPNEAIFNFGFSIPKIENPTAFPVFFNMVFGDYDVSPASILLTLADSSTKTLPINTQPGERDGLVQGAFSTLEFADVFTDGGLVWTASLSVKFIAPGEPYTAFDYVELSRIQLVPEPIVPAPIIPEPASQVTWSVMGGLGIGGAWWRKRRNAAAHPRNW